MFQPRVSLVAGVLALLPLSGLAAPMNSTAMRADFLEALEPATLESAPAARGTVADEPMPIEIDGARYTVRSGTRTPGVKPSFPSAPLIIARDDGTGWIDIAFADEPLDGSARDFRVSRAAGKLVISYAWQQADALSRHAVELRLPPNPMPGSHWTRRPAYPISLGVAGAIAGTHRGVLIAAGGANFPDRMPWDGGVKAYADEIFVLLPGESAWRAAGRLPERRAYAAVVSTPAGVLVAGGENADGVLGDVRSLTWDGKTVRVERGPALPAPRTSPAAVVLHDRIYLAGGYAPGKIRASSTDFWCLDLSHLDAGWKRLPPWPGPSRAQAVMAALDDAIYLVSGLQLTGGPDEKPQATYLRDAYRFRGDAWQRLPDPPWSAIAAPSPAPVTTNPPRVFVLGGVDGRQVGKLPRDTRVPEDVMYYDVGHERWRLWPERWIEPVVTAPAIAWGGEWWIISGESMAGVRTPAVWSWRPGGRHE